MRVRKALFPVAGVAGSRPNTCDPLARFSELRPIVDKPIIQFAIEEARAAGLSTGEAIFVRQLERRGVGHAILLAREVLAGEPFAVIIPNLLVRRHHLPAHPLVAQSYLSIGCQPCTSKIAAGEDERAGRWRGAYLLAPRAVGIPPLRGGGRGAYPVDRDRDASWEGWAL
jgi:UTP-glucose-1-phosphate uridylyltransferase